MSPGFRDARQALYTLSFTPQPSCVFTNTSILSLWASGHARNVKKYQAWAIPVPLPRLSSALHKPAEAELAMKQSSKPVTPPLGSDCHSNGVKMD